MGRKESIHERDPEVKRYMNSLCNVQKNKKQKTEKKKIALIENGDEGQTVQLLKFVRKAFLR